MTDLEIKNKLDLIYQQSDEILLREGMPTAFGKLRASIIILTWEIMSSQPTPEILTHTNNPYME